MIQSTYDPCLLHTEKEGLFGVIGMQTDVGNKAFGELENDELNTARIFAKPIEMQGLSPACWAFSNSQSLDPVLCTKPNSDCQLVRKTPASCGNPP